MCVCVCVCVCVVRPALPAAGSTPFSVDLLGVDGGGEEGRMRKEGRVGREVREAVARPSGSVKEGRMEIGEGREKGRGREEGGRERQLKGGPERSGWEGMSDEG